MRYVWLAVVLLLVQPTCEAQKVKTTSSGPFDFQNSKSYAWGKNHIITRQGKKNDQLIDQKIVEDVNRTLAAKGFKEDATQPDFLISYDAGSSDLAVQVEGAYSPAQNASTATPDLNYPVTQNIWYSVNGQITFHVVDAKSQKEVWVAAVTKKIRDPNKGLKEMPKQVEQMVAKALERFPPKGR